MWSQRARAARAVLVAEYWDRGTGLFRVAPGPGPWLRWRLPGATWHYWWQAHALDSVLDGVDAGDPGAAALARRHVAGITRRVRGDLTGNDFCDDLAWLGLATLRGSERGVCDRRVPLALAAALRPMHDRQVGGFRWRRGDEYHNVPATAPAAMLLAGTHGLVPDGRLQLAQATAAWLHRHVVDSSGLVRDGVRARDGVLVAEGPLWSYNVGTVAGLDVALARLAELGPQAGALLARAAHVVRAGTAALRAGTLGVWRDEVGDGAGADPQLFRGILARYATALVLAAPAEHADIAADVIAQAGAAWAARDRRGRIGPGWVSPVAEPPTLAAHLAGAMALASAARLEAAGLTAAGPAADRAGRSGTGDRPAG